MIHTYLRKSSKVLVTKPASKLLDPSIVKSTLRLINAGLSLTQKYQERSNPKFNDQISIQNSLIFYAKLVQKVESKYIRQHVTSTQIESSFNHKKYQTDVKIFQPEAGITSTTKSLIFIHGGGYNYGNALSYFYLLKFLSNRLNLKIYALEYTLCPFQKLPEIVFEIVSCVSEILSRYSKSYL